MKNYQWIEDIAAKLNAENVTDLSDESINKAFQFCVLGERLAQLAKEYRDAGFIEIQKVEKPQIVSV